MMDMNIIRINTFYFKYLTIQGVTQYSSYFVGEWVFYDAA